MRTLKTDLTALRAVPRTAAALLATYVAQTALLWYLVFLAFSCGPPPRLITKALHVEIYGGDLPEHQFDEEERLLTSWLPQKMLESVSGTFTTFESYEEMNAGRTKPISGHSNTTTGASWVVEYPCLSRTAYLHELFHHMKARVDKDADPKHEDLRWKYIDNNVLACDTYREFGRVILWKEVPKP